MWTFNLEASRTGNFYSGHEPGNHSSNCWSDRENALVLSLEQARELWTHWKGTKIVIEVTDKPSMSPYDFDHELFCVRGGNWYHYRHRSRLTKMKGCSHHLHGDSCKYCGANWCGGADGYWYDSITGTTINEELVT